MNVLTIRAPDAVTALDLVQKRLGDDALILSTRSVDGQVEVQATTDPALVALPPRPRAVAPVTEAPPSAPVVLPRFLTPEGAKAPRIKTEPRQSGANVSSFGAIVERQSVLQAARVVLFGPLGAGKSMAALQLALLRQSEKKPAKPKFFFCGSGSYADGALLAQKSHLLGMETVFCTADTLPPPREGEAQIVVISARCRAAAASAQIAMASASAIGVLVLPAGLRLDAVKHLADMWQQRPQRAILSRTDFSADVAPDLDQLRGLRITPVWVAAPDLLVSGLEPAPVQATTTDPAPAPVMFKSGIAPFTDIPVQELSR